MLDNNQEYNKLVEDINHLILESSIQLENAELHKSKGTVLIDNILNETNIPDREKVILLKSIWDAYKSYDEKIIPESVKNLKDANQILNKLKNNS